MSLNGHSSDSRKRASSDDENFSKEVQLRVKRLQDTQFSDPTIFEGLSLQEPTNVPLVSRAAVMDRLAASSQALPPPPPPADDMDMDQPVVPNFDRMKVPHPEWDEYLSKPLPLTVSCLIINPRSGMEFGHYNQSEESDPLAMLLRINHGHMAEPSLGIKLRRTKNNKGTVKHEEWGSFMEANFTWAPGVIEGLNEDGTSRYQLHSCQAITWSQYSTLPDVIARRSVQPEKGQGAKGRGRTSSILDNPPANLVDRMVVIHFVGNVAQIEAERSAKGTFNQGSTSDVVSFITELFTEPRVEYLVAFLVPESLRMNAGDWINESFAETIARDVDLRTIPWAPYFKDGYLHVYLDMPSIRTFGNRMFCKFDSTQLQALEAANSADESSDLFPDDFVMPEPSTFAVYPASQTYSMMKLFGVPHATTVVREFQWQDGEYRRLSSHEIRFQVVRTFKEKSKPIRATELQPRPQRSEEQVLQESSFYLCGYLPSGCPTPPEGSQWHVHWITRGLGDDMILEEDKKKWVGFVKHMNAAEKRLTKADFLLVAQKPPGAVFIPAVDSFDMVSSKSMQLARLEPETNPLPAQRVLDSIKEFIGEGRTDLDSLRLPLIFGPEKYKQEPVDLSEGVDPDPEFKKQYKSLYDEALEILAKFFNEAQMRILKEALCQIQNSVCLILGGPGCKKTTTMAYAVLVLNMVGHKVLIVAEENLCLDNFMDYLEEAQQVFLNLVAGKPEHAAIENALKDLKYLRHIPPAVEERSLRTAFDAQAAGDKFHAGKVFDPNAFQKDSKVDELFLAYAANEAILQGSDDVEHSREAEELTRLSLLAETKKDQDRIQAAYNRLKEDYKRTHKNERTFTYPTKASLAWHVSQMEADPDKLDALGKQILRDFLEARQACTDETPGTSRKTHKANTKDLSVATNSIIEYILGRVNVVACTYVNCATDLMRNHFRFSVAIHEEASRAKLGTQTAALVYPNVMAHCFVGDPKQMPPMATADQLNEHKITASLAGMVILMEQGNVVWWINKQYRMHPSMIDFSNRQWYEGELKNASHTSLDNPVRKAFREAILERYQVDLSTKEGGKGSQYVAIDVPKGLGLAKTGKTSLENHASANALVSLVALCLAKNIPSGKIGVGVYYKEQGELIKDLLNDRRIRGVTIVTIDAYQGHDMFVWLVDLTGTAHPKEQLLRLLGPGQQSVWQSISGHMKSRFRLNVALTRGKDGIAIFGNFRSISKAVQKLDNSEKSTGKDLSDFIADAIKRDLMVTDATEDTNPALVQRTTTAAARLDNARFQGQQANLAWMGEHREHNVRARMFDIEKARSSKRITFAGPDEGGAFGAFPQGEILTKVKERAAKKLPAKGPSQPSEAAADGTAKKKPKPKPKKKKKKKKEKGKDKDSDAPEGAAEGDA